MTPQPQPVQSQHSRRQHWASLNEFSFVTGMRVLFLICRWFGRWPFRVVLYPVLLWYVLSKPLPRRASLDYLQKVKRLVDIQAGMLGVMKHFAAFAETILDKMLLWGGLFKLDQVQYFGFERMNQAIHDKKGFVMICSHLGNLELCRVLSLLRSDVRLTVLVHTKHAKAFNQMLASLNPDSQVNLMQVTEINAATAMLLATKVEQGEFVVIAGDRVPVSPNPRVAIAEFLGQQAAFPVGPFILASVLQCPIFLLFSMQRDNHYEVHVELLRESAQLPRKGRDQALAVLVGEFAARLQYHCLRAPYQWFNFFDFWHLPTLETSDARR